MELKNSKYRLSAAESEAVLIHLSAGQAPKPAMDPIVYINYIARTLDGVRAQIAARIEFETGKSPTNDEVTAAIDSLGDTITSFPENPENTKLLSEAAEAVAFYTAEAQIEDLSRLLSAASAMLFHFMANSPLD